MLAVFHDSQSEVSPLRGAVAELFRKKEQRLWRKQSCRNTAIPSRTETRPPGQQYSLPALQEDEGT